MNVNRPDVLAALVQWRGTGKNPATVGFLTGEYHREEAEKAVACLCMS